MRNSRSQIKSKKALTLIAGLRKKRGNGWGTYLISNEQARSLCQQVGKRLPIDVDDDTMIARGQHRVNKNTAKRDPGCWVVTKRPDSSYELQFVFNDW